MPDETDTPVTFPTSGVLSDSSSQVDLARVIRTLSRDAAERGVRLTIKGFDTLLTLEEQVRFAALPQQEQLFTALCVLGLDQAITSQVQLSNEALSLIAILRSRLEGDPRAEGLLALADREVVVTVTNEATGQEIAYRFREEKGRWLLQAD